MQDTELLILNFVRTNSKKARSTRFLLIEWRAEKDSWRVDVCDIVWGELRNDKTVLRRLAVTECGLLDWGQSGPFWPTRVLVSVIHHHTTYACSLRFEAQRAGVTADSFTLNPP